MVADLEHVREAKVLQREVAVGARAARDDAHLVLPLELQQHLHREKPCEMACKQK